MNTLWIFLIVILIIFSLLISRYIKYDNYKIFKMLKALKSKNLKGLFLTLGTKIGVGSIIGTTISIYIGGPGSVFWIILFSFITTSLIYYESIIGNRYKEQINKNLVSGPYFYISRCLKNKPLAVITMILLITCYSLFFQMIQTNTIKDILFINYKTLPIIITIVITLCISFLIFFSIKELVELMSKLVPIMCIIYILLCLVAVFKNINEIDNIIWLIISSAFTKRGLLVGMIIGIKRAIFLNEIMIGTTSIGSGVEDIDEKQSARTQTLGIYFITFVISLLTSILILLFKENNALLITNYNELISEVFIYHFGRIGIFILTVIICLFSITTIISGYYIGVSNLSIIIKNKKVIFIFKLFVLLFCICGIYVNSNIIWKYIDILMYILILINTYSLFKIYRGERNDRK